MGGRQQWYQGLIQVVVLLFPHQRLFLFQHEYLASQIDFLSQTVKMLHSFCLFDCQEKIPELFARLKHCMNDLNSNRLVHKLSNLLLRSKSIGFLLNDYYDYATVLLFQGFLFEEENYQLEYS